MLPILREAIQRAGGVSALAADIGVTRSAIYQWTTRIPAERVIAIETVTDIPRSKLRPDLFREPEKRRRKRKR